MKNFKKVLALALVFMLSFSLFAGAVGFTDAADINENYQDDVNMLVELGVLGGYPDGSFRPEDKITRAEFAHIMAKVMALSDMAITPADISAMFTDIRETR